MARGGWRAGRLLATLACMALLVIGTHAASAGAAESGAAGAGAADSARAPGPVDYLWVLRGSLASRSSVDSVVARAARMQVRGLLVQVVGRGDACYASEILPRAEFLPRDADFDPLGELVPRAHAAGLEVHAWMNCLFVWSAAEAPRDPRHVVNAHPEWVSRLKDGRRLTALTPDEASREGVEGVYLSPGHPRVRAWVASVAAEIARRYPVDGVHLDYIRAPRQDAGWDETSCARFAMETGVDPRRTDYLAPAGREQVAAAWDRFQREQVTAIVSAVRDSLRAVRAGVQLSAAVLADTITAERGKSQMWRSWVRDGLLDRAYLMCYAVPVQTVMEQLAAFAREFGGRSGLVPGIAMYNSEPVTAALKIKGARTLGFERVALYSYDSLFQEKSYWDALRGQFTAGAQGTR